MAERVELVPTHEVAGLVGTKQARHAPVKVVKHRPGKVTPFDRIKKYYHTLITLLAAVLIFLNEVTPVFNFLPAGGRHWFDVIVILLTALVNFLKSNETWVDNL